MLSQDADRQDQTTADFRWHHCASVDEMHEFYLSRLPAIREAARECGYAIGLHGSTLRDLDLIAVPWIKDAETKDALAGAIHRAACGLHRPRYEWEAKPCGRLATSFPICWTEWDGCYGIPNLGHIDLSVMGPQA